MFLNILSKIYISKINNNLNLVIHCINSSSTERKKVNQPSPIIKHNIRKKKKTNMKISHKYREKIDS